MDSRNEQQERERLAFLSAQHPGDLTPEEIVELDQLKQKYG